MTLSREQVGELYNLYHLARTALSGNPDQSKYARELWATTEFCKAHPDIPHKWAYLTFERADAGLC